MRPWLLPAMSLLLPPSRGSLEAEEPLLYGTFPPGFLWGAASSAYQVLYSHWVKCIQWLKIYFCIQFTETILGKVVLVKKKQCGPKFNLFIFSF